MGCGTGSLSLEGKGNISLPCPFVPVNVQKQFYFIFTRVLHGGIYRHHYESLTRKMEKLGPGNKLKNISGNIE